MFRLLKKSKASTHRNYNKRRFFYLTSATSIVLIMLGTIFVIDYFLGLQPNETVLIDSNLCHQQHRIKIAEQLELPYHFDSSFESTAIVLIADKAALKAFDQLYDHYYQNQGNEISEEVKHDCHLIGVKYHVKNINKNLINDIPNDVDHVSYDPNGDNAVYCYYQNKSFGSSHCFYIRLDDTRLIVDDISDMERANLVFANNFYSLRRDLDDFSYVRSSVESWTDDRSDLYGIAFQTHYDGNRWGMIQNY